MTNEERDLIAKFVARVGGATQGGGFIAGAGGSVPQAQVALPPMDREADAYIAEQFQRFPEARYRITQMAVVQEAALAEMNNRLTRLQWELEQARHQAQAPPQQQQSKGFFGSLFGGGSSQPQPQMQQGRGGPWGNAGGPMPQPGYGGPQYAPPPPQYPPAYQPGMFGRGGSGFLGSALTTAAGVAGGMVVGNALMNAFSGGHGGIGGGMGENASSGGFLGGSGDMANNAFDGSGVASASDPTGGFGTDAGFGGDPFSQGGDPKGFDGAGLSQDASFDQGGSGGGFDGGGGGGFDGGGFDSGSDNS